jgi:hypothetical protein
MYEKKNTHLQYGLITGIAMVITGLIIYMTGVSFKPGMSYVGYLAYLPLVVGILMNAMAYSKANGGAVTFGNVFLSCFKVSMIVSVIMVVWSILSIYIFPEMKDKIMEAARESMEKKQNMSQESIDAGLGFMQKFWNVFMILGALFGTLLYGVLISLIGGLIAKKDVVRPASDNF